MNELETALRNAEIGGFVAALALVAVLGFMVWKWKKSRDRKSGSTGAGGSKGDGKVSQSSK